MRKRNRNPPTKFSLGLPKLSLKSRLPAFVLATKKLQFIVDKLEAALLRAKQAKEKRPVEHPYKMVVVVGQLHDRNDGRNMLSQFWMPYVFS
jgi:hypothetical protein